MRLPDSVYNQVLRGLGLADHGISNWAVDAGASADHAEQSKRRSFRRRIDAPVQFLRHGALNAKPQTCTLADLSRDGVCVLMDAVVAPGDRFVVYLPRAADDGRAEPLPVLCTARSSRLKADGKFRTGAEFTDTQQAGDERANKAMSVERLAKQQQPNVGNVWVRTAGRLDTDPDANARRTERNEAFGRAMMYLYRDDGRHGPMEQVYLRDYSESGVGILRAEPLSLGEQFVVRVPRGDDKPITRLCRVVNVAVVGGGHRIGAEFIAFPGPYGRSLLARLTGWIA
jgi:hypothetical protein